MTSPVAALHSRRVPFSLPVRTKRLSGEKLTFSTGSLCPFRRSNSFPVAASHSRAVASVLPVAISLPSGEKATDLTASACPSRRLTSRPVALSQSCTSVPDLDETLLIAVATTLLSGEKAMDSTKFALGYLGITRHFLSRP